MKPLKSKRRRRFVNSYRNQLIKTQRICRFILHILRLYGSARPNDDNEFRIVEFTLNDLIKPLTRPQLWVPPHSPTNLFERHRQSLGLRLIFSLVANKDIAHQSFGYEFHGLKSALDASIALSPWAHSTPTPKSDRSGSIEAYGVI